MPFDQFAIEQLAGDLLPGQTPEEIVATGFHRNTLVNEEGGTDKEQFRVEAVMDRVNTTGAVFLGLTVGCAQCHHHKFDPISQRDYYNLFAIFNNCDEPTFAGPDRGPGATAWTTLALQIAEAEKPLAAHDRRSDGIATGVGKSRSPRGRPSAGQFWNRLPSGRRKGPC